MAFVLLAFIFMYVGRKLGWSLSRGFLYSATTPVVVFACVVWGSLVALMIRGLIAWQQPHWILKIIFGFALGAYVAIPNFGLVMESTIPDHAVPRHQLISNVPFLTFIVASVGLAFLL